MFSLTRKSDYGLLMLSFLAIKGNGGRMSLTEMAQRGMPKAFMAQIANSLVRAGILRSKEGRGGGYSLGGEPKKIVLRQVLEAIEGDLAPVMCVLAVKRCPAESICGQRVVMHKVTNQIGEVLERYNLADFVSGWEGEK
ncbi:Rrf2 family transcriptional regulator [Candidatus Collierbacteria bacterium]|nr:Rrf2 family transcriptional regulator [Candidatus Collierbacteria bacterium]